MLKCIIYYLFISVVDESGEPSFISIPGASKCLTTAHVKNAKHCIEQAKVLITNNGIPLLAALEGLKLGKCSGALTIYNPSPQLFEFPDELCTNIDVLMLNTDEASILTKVEVTNPSQAEHACVWFHDKGIPCVVLTMGENGAMVSAIGLDGAQDKCKLLLVVISRLIYYSTFILYAPVVVSPILGGPGSTTTAWNGEYFNGMN